MHYTCLILTEDRQTDIRTIASKALAPFDESIKVPFYDRDCVCRTNKQFKNMLKDPDKPCPSCGGKGTYRSNYSPKAKWDYFIVGDCLGGIERETIEVTELLDKGQAAAEAYAILEPDGTWHQAQSFYDISEEDLKAWPAKVHDILTRNKTCRAIICDLHI